MDTITLEIPKLYGDHHTSAVHQALAQLGREQGLGCVPNTRCRSTST